MLSKPECKVFLSPSFPTATEICRQLQTGKGVGEDSYNGMVDCFRKIIKNEGFSRLYRGISAPIMMEAPKRYGDRPQLRSQSDMIEEQPSSLPMMNGERSIETCLGLRKWIRNSPS